MHIFFLISQYLQYTNCAQEKHIHVSVWLLSLEPMHDYMMNSVIVIKVGKYILYLCAYMYVAQMTLPLNVQSILVFRCK